MPFAATPVQLEILILNEFKSARETQMPFAVTYMWNLKYAANEPICKTETGPWTRRTRLAMGRGEGER